MNDLLSIIQAWITDAQHIVIWLGITSVLLFGVSIPQFKEYPWQRRIILSFGRMFVFLCIIGFSSFLTKYNFSVFEKINGPFVTEGSVSNQAWKAWRNIYGGNFTQENLKVNAYRQIEQTVEIAQENPAAKPLYTMILVDEPVQQNSIEQFNGVVTIKAKQENQDSFNVFTLTAIYEYEIVNHSPDALRYVFRFPLSTETKQYQNLYVLLNDKEIEWTLHDGAIFWEKTIYPDQKVYLKIQYESMGENAYVFRVPDAYEIRNFNLALTINSGNFYLVSRPENTGIQQNESKSEAGHTYEWHINNAILAPEMGINLLQGWPYSPYHEMLIALPRTANACIYFLIITTLILIIYKTDIKLSSIAFLSLIFLLPSFLLLSGGIPHPASITADQFSHYQVMALPILSLISIGLATWIMQKMPQPVKIQIFFFLMFFAGVYPILGLMDEQKVKTAETILQAFLIAYFFIITLINHLKQKEA